MAGTDDESNDQNWPWNNQTFQNMQADHERFMKQLRDEGQRLQRQLESGSLPSSSPSANAENGSGSIGNSSSPFASFKKFIDDNFNTLTEGFKNFPSNLAEVRARMRQEQELRRQEEQDISQRWTGSSNSPDHIRMEVERSSREEKDDAHAATMLLLSESLRRNADVPIEKIEALYADPQSKFGDLDRFASPMLSWGGACYYMPETGDNLPSTRSWRWTCAPNPRWLSADWFKNSPYSPIQLGAHPQAGTHGVEWRAAFEDLLNASLGKPMDSHEVYGLREPHGKVQSTHLGPGLDWMLSLQCRGILPPQLPRFYNDIRGKRELRQKSLSDILSQTPSNIPWSSEPSIGSYNAFQRDFSDLMSEIGTKSTSDTATKLPQSTSKVLAPTTEQDLYSSTLICPSKASESASAATLPKVSSDQTTDQNMSLTEADINELQEELWDAFDAKDVRSVVSLLEEWTAYFPDVRGLVHDTLDELKDSSLYAPPQEWVPTLAKALRLCETCDDEYSRWAAEFTERIAELDKASPEEKARRRHALRRLEDIIGCPHNYAHTLWTTEEIEESVARMEQEAENLERVTGERREPNHPVPAATISPSMRKPDVLSALTTTHTTRLPDGTVTTKVVLKRRFADGSEETHESVHTENEGTVKQTPEETPKKKGWFWS